MTCRNEASDQEVVFVRSCESVALHIDGDRPQSSHRGANAMEGRTPGAFAGAEHAQEELPV